MMYNLLLAKLNTIFLLTVYLTTAFTSGSSLELRSKNQVIANIRTTGIGNFLSSYLSKKKLQEPNEIASRKSDHLDRPVKLRPLMGDRTIKKASFVRNGHSMVYHPIDSTVYVFGGANEREVFGDLHRLVGDEFIEVKTGERPISRTFAALCFDSSNKRLILFGGSKVLFGEEVQDENLLNDTWEFKKGVWRRIHTGISPTPRAEMAMAYDAKRGVIILFGGYTIRNNEYIKLNDTWEFRGNRWKLLSESGPSARNGSSLVYGSREEGLLLFGGSTIDRQYGESCGQTWIWQGMKWIRLATNPVPGVYNSSMAYNMDSGHAIRFGGWNGESRIPETWLFSEQKWTKLNPGVSPVARNHSTMVYDKKREGFVLFGGHDGENVFGDVWLYTYEKWEQIIEVKEIKRINNNH